MKSISNFLECSCISSHKDFVIQYKDEYYIKRYNPPQNLLTLPFVALLDQTVKLWKVWYFAQTFIILPTRHLDKNCEVYKIFQNYFIKVILTYLN